MKNTIEGMRESLIIDPDDLDTELTQQPVLFELCAHAFARAKSRRDKAKERQKTIDARLTVKYETQLKGAGERPTAGAVGARVEKNKEHVAVRDEYKDASFEADAWEGMVEAYRQRNFMLKSLADLTMAREYGTPHVRGSEQEYEAIRERRAEMKRDKSNRKRVRA